MNRVDVGQEFQFRGDTFVVIGTPDSDTVIAQNQKHKSTVKFTREQLLSAWAENELRFPYKGNLGKIPENEALRVYPKVADFGAVSPEYKLVAEMRSHLVRKVLEIPEASRSRESVKRLIAEETKGWVNRPSVATVYRWISRYEAAGRDIRALIPMYGERGGKGKARLPEQHLEILWRAIKEKYLIPEHDAVQGVADHAQYLLEKAGLAVPERKTLYMQVKRLIDKLSPYDVAVAHKGRKYADRHFKATGKGFPVARVLERVEIDHTPLDVLALPDVPAQYRRYEAELAKFAARPYITLCRDRYTKYILGWYVGFEKPSWLTVMQCLYHAILPKTRTFLDRVCPDLKVEHEFLSYGVSERYVVDNGPEFLSKSLEDACEQLGSSVEYNPPGAPWCKPIIERSFRTLNAMMKTLPGTTFAKLADRMGYDSVGRACLPFSLLQQFLYVYFIDIENQRFNESLGTSPARAWEEVMKGAYPPALPENVDELLVLLSMTETRVISAKGIRINDLYYFSEGLADLRCSLPSDQLEVTVKVNPTDLGCVWILDPRTKCYVEVPAEDQGYATGLTLWAHKVIRSYVKKTEGKISHDKIVHAKARIHEALEQHLAKGKRVKGAQRVARYTNGGQQTTVQNVDETSLGPVGEEAETYLAPTRDNAIGVPDQGLAATDEAPSGPPPEFDDDLAVEFEDRFNTYGMERRSE